MLLIPGVIDPKTSYVKHPEVVADRIMQAVEAVGDRSRVIAGVDCGFSTVAGYEMVAESVAGRYHLYIALNCPWACRTLIFRKLKKLDNVISVSIAIPAFTEQGYSFGDYPGAIPDPLYNVRYVHELYT